MQKSKRHDEYGGYIEFETNYGTELHSAAVPLNCGRNCLAYLIETKKIEKIYIPYLLCSSVEEVCLRYGVEIVRYHVDVCFRPRFEVLPNADSYIYLVNYYGQLSNDEIAEWKKKYPNLIVDQSHAFFQMPIENTDTLYTCRKFFGVADGAYLYTDVRIDRVIEIDISFDRMRFLMGRFEKNANEFYADYVNNNRFFKGEPIKAMSKLTHNLLCGLSYDDISKRRYHNYTVLHDNLKSINQLYISVPQVPYMYPLYVTNGAEIRRNLQQQKIYIPTLWPDVFERCSVSDIEHDMALNILPIPVDQRYNEDDMMYLAEVIKGCIN